MRKLFYTIALVLIAQNVFAQSSRQDIFNNIFLSGSNYLAYPAPQKALTPAPKGYKPVHISHYGRHGSRYLIDPNDFNAPLKTFAHADSLGKLSPLGCEVMEKILLMKEESTNRLGELTELGAEQHRQIAHRMFERFPDVFKGDVHVDAKSTTVIRCILSMENELLELATLNPRLRFTHDASQHDMYYMNFNDKKTFGNRSNDYTNAFLEKSESSLLNPSRLMTALFNDQQYVHLYVNERALMKQLYYLTTAIQNTEIRHKISLFEIFEKEEMYNLWQWSNINWFLGYGPCELNGATQPFSQRNLLKNIIQEADSCLQLDRPGATLRFGHETMVLPLTCLLNLNGYGNPMMPDKLEQNEWFNYRIFPMAANIQFVFYRKNADKDDVLVKVLLNEEEATLPIAAATGSYYRWSEVRDYYIKKIQDYENSLQ